LKEEKLAEIFQALDHRGRGVLALPASDADADSLAFRIGSAAVAELVVPILVSESHRRAELPWRDFKDLLAERFRAGSARSGGVLPWPVILAHNLVETGVKGSREIRFDVAARAVAQHSASPPPVPARSFAYRQRAMQPHDRSLAPAGAGSRARTGTSIAWAEDDRKSFVVEADLIVEAFPNTSDLQRPAARGEAPGASRIETSGGSRPASSAQPGMREQRQGERLHALKEAHKAKEMAECTFRPKINPPVSILRLKGGTGLIEHSANRRSGGGQYSKK
jgi:hypothetical protein